MFKHLFQSKFTKSSYLSSPSYHSSSPILQSSNHPIIQCGDGGMRGAFKFAVPRRGAWRVSRLCPVSWPKSRRALPGSYALGHGAFRRPLTRNPTFSTFFAPGPLRTVLVMFFLRKNGVQKSALFSDPSRTAIFTVWASKMEPKSMLFWCQN